MPTDPRHIPGQPNGRSGSIDKMSQLSRGASKLSLIPLPQDEPAPKPMDFLKSPEPANREEMCLNSSSSNSSPSTIMSTTSTSMATTSTTSPERQVRQKVMCFAVNAYKRKVCIISKEKQKSQENKYFFLEPISEENLELFGKKLEDNEVSEEMDDYIHCGDCECFYTYSCFKHPMYHSLDRDAKGYDDTADRAQKTLPGFLYVKISSIPNAGKGVFTKVDIPVGVVFGPYEGILRQDHKKAECDGYSWEIKRADEIVYIDGRDPRYSNWMRFINSSRFESEQNLLAFQFGGSVYYRVFRPIDREKELLVWYGNSYGKALGVNTTPSKANKVLENPLKRRKSKSFAKNPFIF